MPSSKYNLVSISSLVVHLKFIVSFSDVSCLLQAPSLKRPQGISNAHHKSMMGYTPLLRLFPKEQHSLRVPLFVFLPVSLFHLIMLQNIASCKCHSHSCCPYVKSSSCSNKDSDVDVNSSLSHKNTTDLL